MRLWIALWAALALLYSPLAALAGDWTNCRGGVLSSTPRLDKTRPLVCYRFVAADSTTGDSGLISMLGPSNRITFDPNTGSDGVDDAQVRIRCCDDGVKPSSNPENSCPDIPAQGVSALTGLVGDDATQNRSIRVGQAACYVDITTAAGAGDTAKVIFQHEPN